MPLQILNIEDGQVTKSFHHPLHPDGKKLDFIEQFNEKLLVKQQDHDLQIVDVRTATSLSKSKLDCILLVSHLTAYFYYHYPNPQPHHKFL